jgi:ribonuclease PH
MASPDVGQSRARERSEKKNEGSPACHQNTSNKRTMLNNAIGPEPSLSLLSASSSTMEQETAAAHALRPLSCELGCLQSCDGSALWKSGGGGTSVLAAVHGPVAPRQQQQQQNGAAAAAASECQISVVIIQSSSSGGGDGYHREWEVFLSRQLQGCVVTEKYPRSVVSVVLQILNADGSVLAAVLHAAVSALQDAGIDVKFLPTAVTCYVTPNRTIRLDPSADEEQAAQAVLVLVLHPKSVSSSDPLLLGCHTTSAMKLTTQQVLQCVTVAAKAVPAITAFWRLVVEQKVTREAQTLWSS